MESGKTPDVYGKGGVFKDEGFSRSLLQALPVFFVAIGKDGTTRVMNDAMLEQLGYSKKEVIGKDYCSMFVPEEDRGELSVVFEKLAGLYEDTLNENRVVTKDGRELLVEWHGRPILNDRGELDFFFGVGVDITEQRKSEEALRKSEERYRTILENIEEGYFEVDLSGKFTFVNRTLSENLHLGGEELQGMHYRQFLDAENAETVLRVFSEVYRTGVPVKHHDLKFTRVDGTVIFAEASVSLLTGAEGNPLGFRGIIRDVTERVESEALYRTVAQTSRAGVYIIQDKKFQLINSNAAHYAEQDERTMLGRESFSIVHPEDHELVRESAKRMLRGETSNPYEYRIVTKSGKIRWILETVTSIEYKGKPAVLGNSLDVTELREARKRREESERRLSQIVEGSPVPSFVIGNDHRVTHWNQACENLTGIDASDVIGTLQQWSAFYPSKGKVLADFIVDNATEEDIARYYDGKCRKSAIVKGAYEAERFFPDLGEEGKWLSITSAPLEDMEGGIIGAIEMLQDITERKESEEVLRESERRYQQLSITDNLTSLFNRRYLYSQLQTEIERCRRYSHPLSILVLDVDDFKRYNDKFGHLAGDEVLVTLAEVIRECIRKSDSAYRYGGEEFVVILPETSGHLGVVVAERIREQFRTQIFAPDEKNKVVVTLSIGVSELKENEEMNDLIGRADDRMYTAKREGKDRVIFF